MTLSERYVRWMTVIDGTSPHVPIAIRVLAFEGPVDSSKDVILADARTYT